MQDYMDLVKGIENGIEKGGFDKDRVIEDRNGMETSSPAVIINQDSVEEVAAILNGIDGLKEATELRESGRVEDLLKDFGVGELIALSDRIKLRDKRHCLVILKTVGEEHLARLAACLVGNRNQKAVSSARARLLSKIKVNLKDAKVVLTALTILRGRIEGIEDLMANIADELDLVGDLQIKMLLTAVAVKIGGDVRLTMAAPFAAKVCVDRADKLEEEIEKEEDVYIKALMKSVLPLVDRHNYLYELKDYKASTLNMYKAKYYINKKKVYVEFGIDNVDIIFASEAEYAGIYDSKIEKVDGLQEIDINGLDIVEAMKLGLNPAYVAKKIFNISCVSVETKKKATFNNNKDKFKKFYAQYHLSLNKIKELEQMMLKVKGNVQLAVEDVENIVIAARGSKAVSTRKYVIGLIDEHIKGCYMKEFVVDYILDTIENFPTLKDRAVKLAFEYIYSYPLNDTSVDVVIDTIVKLVEEYSIKVQKNIVAEIANDIAEGYVNAVGDEVDKFKKMAKKVYGIEVNMYIDLEKKLREMATGFIFDRHIIFHAIRTECNPSAQELNGIGTDRGEICCCVLRLDKFIVPFGPFGFILKQKAGVEGSAVKLAANIDVYSSRNGYDRFIPKHESWRAKYAVETIETVDDVIDKIYDAPDGDVENELFVEVSETEVVAAFIYRNHKFYSDFQKDQFVAANIDKLIVDIETMEVIHTPDDFNGEFNPESLFFHE